MVKLHIDAISHNPGSNTSMVIRVHQPKQFCVGFIDHKLTLTLFQIHNAFINGTACTNKLALTAQQNHSNVLVKKSSARKFFSAVS